MAPTIEGYLSKKGKRIGSRVKRYMKLEGHVLSNHHSPEDPPTWQISVQDATITAFPRKKKFVLELYNAKMELFCDSKEDCDRWLVAISSAKGIPHKSDGASNDHEDKENKGVIGQSLSGAPQASNGPSNRADNKTAVDEDPTGKKKALDNLSKSFKVVKPPPKSNDQVAGESRPLDAVDGKTYKTVRTGRKSTLDIEEARSMDSEVDDEFAADANVEEEEAHQPKNGKGRIYDDTPNSLIFKQFAFKT
jgi:PH domain